jgi:hypothetical protein
MNNRKFNTSSFMTKRRDSHAPESLRSKPAILGNRPLPKLRPLPPDFDFQLHKKILAEGQVRPTSSEELAERIAAIKQRKVDLGQV